MYKKTFACAAFAAALFLAGMAAAQQPATLTIHPDQPLHAVSPNLYGLMTEEINYSYDGGLYAEMVRNRTFRGDWSGINYWYLLENGDAAAKMAADTTVGPSDALQSSLRLDVDKASAQSQNTGLRHGSCIFLSANELNKGSNIITRAMENINDTKATSKLSLKNWRISWVRNEPTALRMPTSFARFSLRAVLRFIKFMHASSRTNMPMMENSHTNCIAPPMGLPSLKSLYKCHLSIGYR